MSTPKGKENIITLNPVQLSPASVHQSPHGNGLAFDVLLKPASASKKLVTMYTPSPTKDCTKKLEAVEMRKRSLDLENQEKLRQKGEKIKAAKCHVLESIENLKIQTSAKLEKKVLTTEECLNNKKKELEEKRLAREQRALIAKKLKEENLENKKKIAESQLPKLSKADELREANRQQIAEKAKKEVVKVDNVLEAQRKKKMDLDEKINQDLLLAEQKRLKQLNEIKEKCGSHVQDAKTRASLKERN